MESNFYFSRVHFKYVFILILKFIYVHLQSYLVYPHSLVPNVFGQINMTYKVVRHLVNLLYVV